MKHSILLASIFLFGFSYVHAEEINAGFVQGVWYAHEPVIAGQPNRIYVALRNNSESDLTGNVRFTDNGDRIGVAYVSALPGRIVEAWVDWTPGYGEHAVTASLTNVQIHPIGELPETGDVSITVAESAVFSDHDTDKDGIPNQKDPDDDNDGVSDEAEVARGTNPLKADAKPVEDTEERQEQKLPTPSPVQPSPSERGEALGLEKYVPDGMAQTVVASLTENISETKDSLDEYREERKNALGKYFSTPTSTNLTASTSESVATITRSRGANDEGFFESMVRGGKAILNGFYTLLLSLLSKLLSYPAIIELLILLGTIYLIYRTARRFGRRRNN